MTQAPIGVTFLVPVHNGAEWLDECLRAIRAQADGRPMEILAVDDGSTDRSPEILAAHAADGAVRVVAGPGRGATAALNEGLRHAAHPVICQVDQDVVVQPGWMVLLVGALCDLRVAAAQGYYVAPADGSVWARVMGLDLEHRYSVLPGREIDHVCTGNTAYRASALAEVGGFDETLGYGYDNDISYRLTSAGHRLAFQPRARSVHRWRDGCWPYLVQQYGFGYGRLDLVRKHRGRLGGDVVSPLTMMLHPLFMALACASGLFALALLATGRSPVVPGALAGLVVTALVLERLLAGIRSVRRFGDTAGYWFAPVHVARDLAWVAAIAVWAARWAAGVRPRPSASMRPRTAPAARQASATHVAGSNGGE